MDKVRAQYEAYPYPARDPKDERKRLVTGSPSHLLEIEHYLFAGRRDWSRPFRALVAGGGTGDGTIMLAQHLVDRGAAAEIVYLDLSTSSRRIAEARAAHRKLTNVTFHTGSLLDAAALGTFDYIDCCGVLHHLEDPEAGLRALIAALKPAGGLGLMLYGALGRTGVYPMQAMLRTLDADVAVAKRLLAALPPSNWLRRNPHLSDHLQNDAGLYDLLLHSQDRAYLVPEIFAMLDAAGLRLVTWIEPMRYAPETYLADPALRRPVAALGERERAAFAENLCGSMKTHTFYAVRAENAADTVARFAMDAIPVLRDLDGAALARGFKPGQNMSIEFGGHRVALSLPPLTGAILARIDGTRSFAAIEADLPETKDFAAHAEALYGVMNGLNRMLLRCRA